MLCAPVFPENLTQMLDAAAPEAAQGTTNGFEARRAIKATRRLGVNRDPKELSSIKRISQLVATH